MSAALACALLVFAPPVAAADEFYVSRAALQQAEQEAEVDEAKAQAEVEPEPAADTAGGAVQTMDPEPELETPGNFDAEIADALAALEDLKAEGALNIPVDKQPPMWVFPVVGHNSFSDSFGAPRPNNRRHKGVDIFADKLTPVVAVADGVVAVMPTDTCCYLMIVHDTGWRSWYIHLNNDTPGTDDGQGHGYAEGISRGTHVQAGDVIGYVGDSGNAEDTPPHLHFELHDADDRVVNPYQYLRAVGAVPVSEGAVAAGIVLASSLQSLPDTGVPAAGMAGAGLAVIAAGLAALGTARLRLGRKGPPTDSPG